MHVKALKVFCDVVGRRSFSRAADENGISQSGASQMVHHLEERLGVKLIDRSKRPLVLTPEGELYYQGCRELIQTFEALEEQVRTMHREVEGRVSVASIYSVGLSHMSQLVQEFLAAYPKANVRLEYQHPERVYELVESDQVDVGLVSYPKSSRSIEALTWRVEPMVLVVGPQHALAARRSVSLRELDGLRLVGFDERLKIRHAIDRVLAAHGVSVEVVIQFDNIETLKRAVEIDAGVSLLPAPTVAGEVRAGTLSAIPLDDVELVRPLGIVYRRGKQLSITAKRFMQLLQKSAARPPDAVASSLPDEPAAAAGERGESEPVSMYAARSACS